MSQFMPDGPNQTQPSSGVADITPASSETSSADIALMQRVLSAASRNPNLIPADFMAYVLDWIQTQRLMIPIGQVFGFSQFTASVAEVGTQESTASTTFTDLTTVGPEVTGLADGQYLILYGGGAFNSNASNQSYMSVGLNGVAADSADQIRIDSGTGNFVIPGARGLLKTLKSGSGNSVVMKYAASANTSSFLGRWLVVLKVANA